MESSVMTSELHEAPKYALYTISEGAKYLDIYYQRITYAIYKKWITPAQVEPIVLITRPELDRFRREHIETDED